MRISVIDIGTNTILLLIAEVEKGRIAKVNHDEQVIARLGKGVDERRVITDESIARASTFLEAYRRTSSAFKAERIVAVGTSALRDASNRAEVLTAILNATGIGVEVLSGQDEAEWTYRGAIGANDRYTGDYTVLDIGGGSTEIISGTSARVARKVSLDIGCVRITERILKAHPPTRDAIEEARSLVAKALLNADLTAVKSSRAIGVAGTVTTLAAMMLGLDEYDPQRVEGFVLRAGDVSRTLERMSTMKLEEIREIRQISPGRADILLAGILILSEFISAGRLDELRVSDRGLRYGIMLREAERLAGSY